MLLHSEAERCDVTGTHSSNLVLTSKEKLKGVFNVDSSSASSSRILIGEARSVSIDHCTHSYVSLPSRQQSWHRGLADAAGNERIKRFAIRGPMPRSFAFLAVPDSLQ